eukprot:CAMPEP_0181169222 /NCGR_PEP_ID=MMETSP1096-20121128/697_2 /TAXON_ID=156174 ORGANISM="Chrysochromulina ericina, Strain CCMP281" /NCGR_SAMPLE_ID=MMETSP1096 /ASSEMBLY_ACC=CAM_ASM_000453 /LENGTH=113 /DNA_ID=CAMNT_0023256661 /DNA_START=236 /DNA_END=578 /DNA_ORIENTATION=-
MLLKEDLLRWVNKRRPRRKDVLRMRRVCHGGGEAPESAAQVAVAAVESVGLDDGERLFDEAELWGTMDHRAICPREALKFVGAAAPGSPSMNEPLFASAAAWIVATAAESCFP